MNIQPPKHTQKPLSDFHAATQPTAGSTPEPASPQDEKPKGSGEGWRSFFSTIFLVVLAFGVAFSIAAFGVQSYQVDGQSMETTLQNSDRLIVNKIPRTWSRLTHHNYVPKRGSIIIFNQAGLFDANGLAEKQLIKRVVGLPGDRVVVKNNVLTIYNTEHPNGYNPDKTGQYKITAKITPGDVDVTLKPGQIFVCGDNRTNSEDSRYFGPINVDQIVGQLMIRIIPLNHAQRF